MKHVFLATALLSASLATGAQAENLTLATGSSGGTYFPVGVALSTLVSDELAESSVRMSPITTGGSAENVELLATNEAQVAIMFGIYGRDGYRGIGLRDGRPPIPELRSITALWPDYDQFVIPSATADPRDPPGRIRPVPLPAFRYRSRHADAGNG